jgi:hypothetical protein
MARWAGETPRMFWDRVCAWHVVFAWLPCQLSNGTWVWWEYVEGRSMTHGPTRLDVRWEYREASE